MNMYAYVKNDPVNATDPTGLVCASRIEARTGCSGVPEVQFRESENRGGSGSVYTPIVGANGLVSGISIGSSSGSCNSAGCSVTATRTVLGQYNPSSGRAFASYLDGREAPLSALACLFGAACHGRYLTPEAAANAAAQGIAAAERPGGITRFRSGTTSSERHTSIIVQRRNGTYAITRVRRSTRPPSVRPIGAVALVLGVGDIDFARQNVNNADRRILGEFRLSQGFLITFNFNGPPSGSSYTGHRVTPFTN